RAGGRRAGARVRQVPVVILHGLQERRVVDGREVDVPFRPIEEDAEAAAYRGLAAVGWRPGDTDARRDAKALGIEPAWRAGRDRQHGWRVEARYAALVRRRHAVARANQPVIPIPRRV